MTRLGIVVALEAEARTLGLPRHSAGEIIAAAPDVSVCISGIGPQRARSAGARLLARGATALLSWGTAVALHAELAPGQLLLPQRVLNTNGESVPVCLGWRQQLSDTFGERFPITDRPLIATDHVLAGPAQKKRLYTESGAVAADMESTAVAEVAGEADVPFVALRSIADSVETAVPACVADPIDEYGRVKIAAVLPRLLKHPADWPGIVRLAGDFRAALKSLRAIGNDSRCADLKPVFTSHKVPAIA